MDTTALESRPSSIAHLMANASLDQVSSLRAAALSTLRAAKRRKPGVEKVAPSRPPPPTSIQLDYGLDEDPSPNTQLSMKPPSPGAEPNVVQSSSSHPEPVSQDVQMREEGEISEEEEVQPPAPQTLKETCKSPINEPKSPAKSSPPARPFSTAAAASNRSPSTSRRIPEVSPVSPLSSRHRSTTPSGHRIQLSAAQLALLTLDANHVRPGLQMNQQQYDTAKDIILDLLGWGVPPEYLVECGLSREIVFYVFVELNLRLPQNLDTGGLIPYTPESVASARQAASLSMPQDVHRLDTLSPRSPVAKPDNASLKSLDIPSAAAATETCVSPDTLHDMEMQRKQELLARKRAVIASRKYKKLSLSSHASLVEMTPDEPSSAVSADVDSFLKSISASEDVDGPGQTPPSGPTSSFPDDAMDVDDIPGLGGLPPIETLSHQQGTSRLTPPYKDSRPTVVSPTGSSHSAAESLHPAIEKTDSVSSVDSSSSATREHARRDSQSRRGAKRPVASDFVDLDTNSRIVGTNEGGYKRNHLSRRKVTAAIDFGSVSNGNRRCVIDLSDSEEETEDMLRPATEKGSSMPTPGSSSTPPIVPSPSVTPGGIKEPSQLELEIQRMKELIAMKERERLKKLASRAHVALETPGTAESIPKVKQEEADHILDVRSPLASDAAAVPSKADPSVIHGNNGSSDGSVASVAAALAGPSKSTTPGIDDDLCAINAQEEEEGIKGEPAEDVVMQNVASLVLPPRGSASYPL